MWTYILNVLFWFVFLSCCYFLDYYVWEMQWGSPLKVSLIVMFLASITIPSFFKFVMKWELFSFKKIKAMKKSEFIKLLRLVFVANGTLFIVAYYINPKYFVMYSFAGITLCMLQTGFGMIKNKRENLEW